MTWPQVCSEGSAAWEKSHSMWLDSLDALLDAELQAAEATLQALGLLHVDLSRSRLVVALALVMHIMHHYAPFRYIQIHSDHSESLSLLHISDLSHCFNLLHLGRNDLLSRPLQPVGLRANLTRCGDALHIPAPFAPCHALPQRTAPRPWMSWEKSLQRTSARLRQGLGLGRGVKAIWHYLTS